MYYQKAFLVIIVQLVLCVNLFAQKGFLRGNVTDAEFGGPMIGATITLKDQPTSGTITDFDGNYSLPLDPGTYTINYSFVSYATISMTDVVIKAGEVTIVDVDMKAAAEQLQEFQVTAKAKRSSEAGLLMEMKKSSNVVDGLSSQTFKKIGDSDLSGAMKRVTGVTVQDGKYVYVRGLGDRYTLTNLNSMTIPGLDPDKNSVQIDVFPTSVLENVAVFKTFSPNLPGDFTGGLVNVITKDFPEEKNTGVSIGMTYIPTMHFNSDYILYNGGNTDFLGFDDGTRKSPLEKNANIPIFVQENPELERITRKFDPQMGVKSKTALPNLSLSFNHGNQITKEKATLGYNFIFNYSNENTFYEDFQSNDYMKDIDKSITELEGFESRIGKFGVNNVMWTGFASGAYKRGNTGLSLMLLHSQGGESSAVKRINRNLESTSATLAEEVLTYTQRSLTSTILQGDHNFNKLKFEWKNAFTISRVYDPDFRVTSFSIINNQPVFNLGDGAKMERFYRDLNEINESIRGDFTYDYSKSIKMKFGGQFTYKTREFEVDQYEFRREPSGNVVDPDPDWFLNSDNIWSADPNSPNYRNGTYVVNTYQEANQYDASSNVIAAYAMIEHPLAKKFRLIYGARLEKAMMFYTGKSQKGDSYKDENTLDELNILPALNMVYELNDKMNLRASATQTLSRPSFREKSIAQIYDPITRRTFIGNIDLKQVNISNFDLRYEYFIKPKELFAVSTFYKRFDGHIEIVSFPTAPDQVSARNSGNSDVYGVELELRKGLEFVPVGLFQNLFLSTNFSYIQSFVDMKSVTTDPETGQSEYELRQLNARDGESIKETRSMAGQAPYMINAALTYSLPESKTNISLAYNVQGEHLSIVGSGRTPDVYTEAFHSLNLNMYTSFGENKRSKVTFGVTNILDDDKRNVYRSYETEDQIYSTYKPGLGISLKYGYTF